MTKTVAYSTDQTTSVDALLGDVVRRACAYLETLSERPVAPSVEAIAALSRIEEPLPATPSDPAYTLAVLDDAIAPATMAMAGPRFFGFVIGGTLPVALAANWLAGAWDQMQGSTTQHLA